MMHSATLVSTPLPVMSSRRVLRAYCNDARYEALRMLRAPAFAIPFLLIPAPLYLLFGVVMATPSAARNPGVYDFLFIGFCVMAVMGPALFGVGSTLAPERDAGLARFKRALPAPAGSYLVAKFLMAMFFAALAVGTMIIAAKCAGKISLSELQLLVLSVVLVLGALPFCALGLFIGAHFSGAAAPGITNLIYLPMIYLGGLFIPLPAFLQKWVVIWPAFHLQQVVVATTGMSKFQFLPPLLCAAVLLGITVLFGGLAIRRISKVG
ncbi:MAG TPA: ABC transporter permease [Steroidobacteraceae bacterium]|jgi:ABC-2 type transport system permease protein|nr:ABC transporter permease [Steroidobacteraceae bacterium]